MRISELIYELQQVHEKHGNLDIITAQDDEGNNYGFLDEVYVVHHRHGNVYAGFAVDLGFDWWANVDGIHEMDVERYKA